MKNVVIALFLFGSYFANAQVSLNDYKYIIVPKRFDGFKDENKHQTSTLIKHLFTKKGFKTVYDDALPTDLNENRCLGLTVDLEDASSMFTTKTTLHLKDCNGAVIMTTKEGKSKEKDFKAAYRESITEAFGSFDTIYHSYTPKSEEPAPVTISFKNDVKSLDENKKEAKNKPNTAVVKQKATTEEQSYKSVEPVESNITKAKSQEGDAQAIKVSEGVLYAQEVENGYQLVDSTPKIRLKLLGTSMPDYYLVESDTRKGVVYKKNDTWFFEYYQDGQLTVEELNIKF
ncbi:hypothetical protein [Maribacter halichondriae]|uniref:hypothetical protein n=1 Tax=Maribacter halichondriae TaxID=2980554 RepID=UPI002359F300|nr:hypothetical protein [Maribacter sp. Hal144]